MKPIIIFLCIARVIQCVPTKEKTVSYVDMNRAVDDLFTNNHIDHPQGQVDHGNDYEKMVESMQLLVQSINKEHKKLEKDMNTKMNSVDQNILKQPNEIYECNKNISSTIFCPLKQAIELGQIGEECLPDVVHKTKIRSISKQVSKEVFISPNVNITVMCGTHASGKNVVQVCRDQIINKTLHFHYHGFYDVQNSSQISDKSFCSTRSNN